jgi:hypothetical protein
MEGIGTADRMINGSNDQLFNEMQGEGTTNKLDLSPFLAQKVKAQNSSNGEFESWGYRAGSLRKSLRLPRSGN